MVVHQINTVAETKMMHTALAIRQVEDWVAEAETNQEEGLAPPAEMIPMGLETKAPAGSAPPAVTILTDREVEVVAA